MKCSSTYAAIHQIRFGTAYTQATKMDAAVSTMTVFSYCVSANMVNGIVSYGGCILYRPFTPKDKVAH